jgi:hypothetical protein
MSVDLLAKLKPLQHQRGDVSLFPTHTEFQTWSDNALPLLAFNPSLQSQLKSAVHAAYINLVQEFPEGVLSNINRAIGIVNQAVIELESAPLVAHAKFIPLEVPEKLTLRWVQNHVPWPVYVALCTAFIFFFTLGWQASSMLANIHTSPLSNAAPTTTNPTIANPAIVQSATPKPIASTPK